MHALLDLFAILPLCDGNIKLALQVQPELGAVAQVATEAGRSVSGDGAPCIQNICDAA